MALWTACTEESSVVPSDDASSAAATTAASYSTTYTWNAAGTSLTMVINGVDNTAKNVSHLNFAFSDCDGKALTVDNITGITGNGIDYMGKLGSEEGRGNDCFGLLADPFVKLDQGFNGFPVTIVISFDTPVKSFNYLLKAGSSNGNSGGGCFGLNNVAYSTTHDCTPPPACYDEDTAWSTGPRYVTRGNWATYTPYVTGGTSANFYAGQNKFAGVANFSAVSGGNVTITITLNPGWSLQEVSNPVKIQGYNAAPSGNPSPGRFASKGSSLTVTVPEAKFYGVHLDARQAVQCPN
jgi:hypothetical protein